jgi:GAF domain-containing protein
LQNLPEPVPEIEISANVTHSQLAKLMKAVQTLAGEIVLDELLTKLMNIAIENSGAQRGCAILENNDRLEITAIIEPESTSVLLSAIPLDSEATRNLLSAAIVNYVITTEESIAIDFATEDLRFDSDPYIIDRQPRSILCTPLIYKGKCTGILYLENNLASAVFTPQQLEIIQFISIQAAIFIENAQRYDRLALRFRESTIGQSPRFANELTQTNERNLRTPKIRADSQIDRRWHGFRNGCRLFSIASSLPRRCSRCPLCFH